jgi:mRNA-degrading endonuclease RelE of RelBE toxin-antitoxin system
MQAEYNLEFTKLFVKQFEKLDRANQKRVYKKILELKKDPFRHRALTGPFKGCHRMHVGKYRVIYLPKKDIRKVFLIDVDLRSRVYQKDIRKIIERISEQILSQK